MKVPFISPKPMGSTDRQGFTLIELLLTLAIFGVMVSLVSSSFFQFHKQNKRVQEEISLRQEMRSIERLLRTDLSHAVYLSRFMDSGVDDGRATGIVSESIPTASGGEDRLFLHVRGKSLFFRGSLQKLDPHLHEVGYFPKRGDQGKLHLVRREQFYIDSDITSGEGIQHSLTEHLTSFELRFFRSLNHEEIKEWKSDGSQAATTQKPMPEAVKVSITLQGGNGRTLTSQFTVNIRPKISSNIRWEVQ